LTFISGMFLTWTDILIYVILYKSVGIGKSYHNQGVVVDMINPGLPVAIQYPGIGYIE